MKIALYDNEENILEKYRAILCKKMSGEVSECIIDCYTDHKELEKVISSYDLVLMTEYAMKYVAKPQDDGEVILVSGSRVETVTIADIIYIEADLKQVHIFLKGGGEIVIRLTFRDVEQQLSGVERPFIKIHRSYIVAMDMIRRIENKSVELKNDVSLPVSKYRLQEVVDSYLAYQESQAIIIREAAGDEEPEEINVDGKRNAKIKTDE